MKYENKEICQNCGLCCLKSGCDYFVSDFPVLNLKTLEEKLEEGKTSIVSAMNFREINGKLIPQPILYLRSRNINRGIIDLISMKTTCASLKKDGCSYPLEKRPGGAVHLIPQENLQCYSDVNRQEELLKWLNYQKLLARLVKRYTNMSVNERIRLDIEQLFYDIFCKNFEGVHELEILDVLNFSKYLEACYPQEAEDAYNKARVRKRS